MKSILKKRGPGEIITCTCLRLRCAWVFHKAWWALMLVSIDIIYIHKNDTFSVQWWLLVCCNSPKKFTNVAVFPRGHLWYCRQNIPCSADFKEMSVDRTPQTAEVWGVSQTVECVLKADSRKWWKKTKSHSQPEVRSSSNRTANFRFVFVIFQASYGLHSY